MLRFLLALPLIPALFAQSIPRVWDEEKLKDWATPVAGLNRRASHVTAAEYYAAPESNLRTYPVYLPGKEPPGYWEWLQRVGPQPLIEPGKLTTEAEWIAAGKRVFAEGDIPTMRRFDPKLIERLRSAAAHQEAKSPASASGKLYGVRWIVTEQGVGVTAANCSGCHLRILPDGTEIDGPSGNTSISRLIGPVFHAGVGVSPMPAEPLGMTLWRDYGAPWVPDDRHETLKNMPVPELRRWFSAAIAPHMFPRWGASVFYPVKIPDLIGVRDRKYLDHTGTHQHREIGDLMRYAAQVSWAEAIDFGEYRMMPPEYPRVFPRLPDAALFALAKYVYALQPPPNPNPRGPAARRGAKVFARAGCAGCHPAPLYTNNKLTLAAGFLPPPDRPPTLAVLPVSVGTDPGLALRTRKGTGYYKVPSLRGVWYRGRFLHDGSVASLEEMFDPARLEDGHVPGGWRPPDVATRAIPGHRFGLDLSAQDRAALIAFLRTL